MQSFIRTSQANTGAQWLSLRLPNQTYYPCILHITIDQNKPYGDKHTFREHTHPVFHLVLYTANKGHFCLNGRRYPSQKGTLAVVSPGQSHDFVTDRANTVYSEITFTYEDHHGNCLDFNINQLIMALFGTSTRLDQPILLNDKQTRQLKSTFVEIIDFADQPDTLSQFYEQRALLTVFDMLITLGNIERTNPTEHESLALVRQNIRKNFHLPLNIDDLALECGISRGYLFRLFKREYQMTPLEYQQQLRIEAARNLLRTTSLRCNEIAARVGYDNSYYFHRVFKNHTRTTPRQFRLNFQKD